MTDPDIMLSAEALTKSFGGALVVQNVSLNLRARNIVTVIGPNGGGKTTLLKLLLGLEKPDSGTVYRRPGLKIGYVPQRLTVDPILPVTAEYFLSLSAGGDRAAVRALAEETGVGGLLASPLQSLSGGEFQRVLLARALLRRPELLVLDEPAQGVDVTGQALLYELIARISRAHGLSVLMVSHDLHLVMSATDHVVCLNRHVCCEGHPHSVRDDPAFAAMFGQHVAATLAVYTHHHDHEHL